MKVKAKSLKVALLLVAAMCSTWLVRAGVQMNTTVPISQEVDIDTNGDGLLEDVLDLQGNLHMLITQTVDKTGGVHWSYSYQPVNVTAVGAYTGDTYRAVGLTRESGTATGDNVTDTFVNNFYMIGQRSGIKYLVHETAHITIVAGQLVVSVDHAAVRCP